MKNYITQEEFTKALNKMSDEIDNLRNQMREYIDDETEFAEKINAFKVKIYKFFKRS